MAKKDCEYFIGKMCSVFTDPLQRDFSKEGEKYLESVLCYFLGTVESLDDHGCLLTQTSGQKTYIFRNSLKAIAEEEVVEEDLPAPKEVDIPIPQGETLNINEIENVAEKLKSSFSK
jgi:hypothetical protein